MGTKTGIEWTDATWNPVRGCTRVSEGCRNCYAEKMAYRFSQPGQPYEGLAVLKNGHASWTGKVEFVGPHLLDPLKWRTPRRIFVNSMSDLFHENVTDEMRDRIFAVMALCPQHTFQVLTKRPERMLDYISRREESGPAWRRRAVWMAMSSIDEGLGMPEPPWPLPNVWLGVSVENQKAADERIPLLLLTPAAVRFISAEPLLGPVRIDRAHEEECAGDFEDCAECGGSSMCVDYFTAHAFCAGKGCTAPGEALALGRLDWVICGGESGPGARPMHPDWARSLRDQCAAAGVPFFFKQWGEWEVSTGGGSIAPGELWISPSGSTAYPSSHALNGPGDVYCMRRVGKHLAGALLDGVEHKAFPEAR